MNNATCTRLSARAGCLLLGLLLSVANLQGCSSTASKSIHVDATHEAGAQYAPEELAHMMTDLGYRQLRVEDPVTQQSVSVAEQYGEYRLLFQSLENDNIRVDIHADITDARMTLYFYDIQQAPLGESALQLYEKLVERARFEFGTAHVSASPP